jgi:uncharacterized protein
MALKVNLRHLEDNELHLKGELPLKELDIDPMDDIISLSKPLAYDLNIEKLDNGLLVRGRLGILLDCQCVRCLKDFAYRLKLDEWTLHLPLEGDDAVQVINDSVDLTPYVRDDILLAFPQHPLCEPDCKGLSRPKKTGQVGKRDSELASPAWAELNKLKLK